MTAKTEASLDLSRLGLQSPCTKHILARPPYLPSSTAFGHSRRPAATSLVGTSQFRPITRLQTQCYAHPSRSALRPFPASPSLSHRPLSASGRLVPCIYCSLDLPRCAGVWHPAPFHVVNLELGLAASASVDRVEMTIEFIRCTRARHCS